MSILQQKRMSANLLYFIIKNHPFENDGNKRVGAFTFLKVMLLERSKIKNYRKITPETLTALALLIAESRSK